MADKFIDSERFLKLSIVILVALLAMVSIVSIRLHLKHVETELRTSEDVRALEEKLQAIRKASDSEWTGSVESLKGQIQELQSQLKTAENSRSFWTMGGATPRS